MRDEGRVESILAEWLDRRERGEAPEPGAVIREHPDLAEALQERFAALNLVDLAFEARPASRGDLPERIGPFRVVDLLGTGGMGTVVRAVVEEGAAPLAGGREVALKVIHPHLIQGAGYFKRFLREAELGRRVAHANVVRTLDADARESDGRSYHYLVMEYVEGQTLRDLLDEVDRVPEELCRHVAREVAKGLGAIHAAGIVHRDLKPENVLITREHEVKVMDLGVARLADESMRLSQTGAFVGSIAYAAPEQFGVGGRARGEDSAALDPRTDLHALGVLLYELAAGAHPYGDDDLRSVMRRILTEAPRRLGEANPQVSPFFEEVVHTLLAKDPGARFADAGALLAVLEQGETGDWWKERSRAIRATTNRPLRRVRIPRETAVYGRDAELQRLRGLWEQAKSGGGNVLLVEGEAGIGKTRLVDEFVGLLQQGGEDLNFLFGSYPPGGAATASGAFSTAYREHFGDGGCAPYLGQTPLLVPAFDALLRGDAAPPGSEPLTKDSLQTVFVHATRNLAAERPTIVLIEDLHFAPEEGRALFASLAHAVPGHRVLLVATTRPGLPEQWRAQVERLAHVGRMDLQRLGAKDLVRLLADTLRSERLATELSGLIALKSDGNPFFVFEMLRGLREGQFLRQRPDGTWHTTEVLRDIQVPSSITDLIQGRIADLDDDDRNLLDLASCCGFEFDPVLAARAAGQAPVPVLQRLAKIEKRHRLVRAAGRRFVFDHHQVQEALYGGLPEPLRESYHAAIADALESAAGAASKDPKDLDGALCVDLAEHFLKGALGARAPRYLDRALEHLSRNHLRGEVVKLATGFCRVPELLNGAHRVRTLATLADSAGRLSLPDVERASLADALTMARNLGLGRETVQVLTKLARCHLRRQDHAAARVCADEALTLAVAAHDRVAEAEALGWVGLSRQHSDGPAAVASWIERQLALAIELADVRIEANARLNLAHTLGDLGRSAEAQSHAERYAALVGGLADKEAEGRGLRVLGNIDLALGRHSDACRRFEAAAELFRATGHRQSGMRCLSDLARALGLAGQHAAAREICLHALTIARETGDRSEESVLLTNLSVLDRTLGRFDEARDWLGSALEIVRRIGHRRGEAVAIGNLGTLAGAAGRLDEARGLLGQALVLSRSIGHRYSEAHWLHGLGAVAANAGEAAAAEDLYRQAISVRREIYDRIHLVGSLASLGRLLVGTGRIDEAREAWNEALTIARDTNLPGAAADVEFLVALHVEADLVAARRAMERGGTGGDVESRIRRHFELWRATRDVGQLRVARRVLDDLLAGASPADRASMLANVRLHREIVEACRAEGIAD